ncbi:MAG: glutathione S-transferase [Pseudolabrys sp.]|nr:glutathione S-transferase [Pseudolabrys sp.]MBV9261229.1 glutathione S-transferase [Pseudolabrys sp.]
MKLYDSKMAPNPRRVRIYLAEKGIEVPTEQVDMMKGEHKTAQYTAINALQRMPALVLDDGTIITESIAICRYFEAQRPNPPMFGTDPKDISLVEMWNRRCEINLLLAVANVFRHLHPAMKELEVPQIAAWGEANKPRVVDFLKILNEQLGKHKFVAGDRYTVADITAQVAVDFLKPARIPVPDELTNVKRWHAEVSARPTAKA